MTLATVMLRRLHAKRPARYANPFEESGVGNNRNWNSPAQADCARSDECLSLAAKIGFRERSELLPSNGHFRPEKFYSVLAPGPLVGRSPLSEDCLTPIGKQMTALLPLILRKRRYSG